MDAPKSPRMISLVGMMGAGKTTVGRRLARRLGWSFVDADREMEARLGVPVTTIFELEGEAGFRRRECELIDELTRRTATVLATGGGAVLDPANRAVLHERSQVIYLRASVGDLWHRLRRDTTRPLLRTADPRARIEALVTQREPLYRDTAHMTVETGRQPVERVVDAIVARLPAAFDAGVRSESSGTLAPEARASEASLSEVPSPLTPPNPDA
jgi:shikimate kinase